MNAFQVKKIMSNVYNIFGISDFKLGHINKRYNNNYIRIVNYHDIHQKDASSFEEQLKYFARTFVDVSYENFNQFMNGEYTFTDKPGIIITFDDGLIGNYEHGLPALEKYGFTGWFYVSTGLIGNKGYMTLSQINKLKELDHVIGCHTYSHHRMNETDNNAVLEYEIIKSKHDLEKMTDSSIEIFCWCGGEEIHYTNKAQKVIEKAGYKYSMQTNSFPVISSSNPYFIQRINIEAGWNIPLVKLQICGFMDKRMEQKRKRIVDKFGFLI